jgi:hypothetical protein
VNAANAYKALCQEDKSFLSDTAQKVAMLVDKSKKMNYFRKEVREFGGKWEAYKTYSGASRKGKWQPSMKKPRNPLETIWPQSAGPGRFPFFGGDIRIVLGAYTFLAVIHDKILLNRPSIAKGILPKDLVNKIWRDLITGANLEDSAIIPDTTYYPKRVIPVDKIESFLRDVTADIESHFAPKKSTAQKLAASSALASEQLTKQEPTEASGAETREQQFVPEVKPITATGLWKSKSLKLLRDIDSNEKRDGIGGDQKSLKRLKEYLRRRRKRKDMADTLYLENKRIKTTLPYQKMFAEK